MRIFLSVFCLLFTFQAFGQQYSQYNTGTLYESFENPAVQSFIPDTSRRIAFNLFIPNVTGNFYLTGNAQSPLKSRAFTGRYNDSYLTIGEGRYNRANATANAYLIMFRAFGSMNGNTDMGFAVQTRMDSRGIVSDETIGLFNGANFFPADHYDNLFNNNFTYQAYHQISFAYRENITKKFALGIKLSALLGIEYQKLDVRSSSIDIDRVNDKADLAMAGTYIVNYTPGGFTRHDFLPTFRNPGAAISIGTTLRTSDGYILQGNVKDLGFIHWSSRSTTYGFDASRTINDLSGARREDSIYKAASRVVHTGAKVGSFITPTNGKLEVSGNKTFWINQDLNLRYSPTLVASKEIFFPGLSVAMVNPVLYKNLSLTLTSSYDTYRIFHLGGQFMVKAPNVEFFIGSERISQSGRLILASKGNEAQIARSKGYTGADVFLGFSVKFGSVIEHPMNASYIPMGEDTKGFFGRLWSRIFNKGD